MRWQDDLPQRFGWRWRLRPRLVLLHLARYLRGGSALALEPAQLRHQIPLALARHGVCNVIAEHGFTLMQRRLLPNTFSSM
jgi:hypothetical protein